MSQPRKVHAINFIKLWFLNIFNPEYRNIVFYSKTLIFKRTFILVAIVDNVFALLNSKEHPMEGYVNVMTLIVKQDLVISF